MLFCVTCLFQSQVKERGGDCVPVICDSTNDQEIKDLFEQIKREQNGRLDMLVNNAYAGVHVSYTQLSSTGTLLCLLWQLFLNFELPSQAVFENLGKKFWEIDPSIWDSINNTGLRYVGLYITMSAMLISHC